MSPTRNTPRNTDPDDMEDPLEELDEGPQAADLERFSGVTQSCPACGAELYDDAELCWKCGHALSGRAKAPPTWAVILVMVIVTLLVLYMIF